VRFGWHVESPWAATLPVFGSPLEPTGFRLRVGPFPVAFGCVLGELDETGRVGPVRESELIAFPIGPGECPDQTPVCPEGFATASGGLCVFTTRDSASSAQDPMGSSEVCDSLPGPRSLWSYLPMSDASVLSSPSLRVRAEVHAEDAQSEACKHDTEIVAMAYFIGDQAERIEVRWIVLNEKTSTSVSYTDPEIRVVEVVLETDFPWSVSPDVCCERTFQTTWTVTVEQCEGW
jgi:hypothetical protein